MGKARWVDNDLWYLLNLEPKELYSLYPNYAKSTIRDKRSIYKKKLAEGKIAMPPSPEQTPSGEGVNREESLQRIADLLARSNIDINDIDRVTGVTAGDYEVVTKNAEGEAEKHRLEVNRINFIPKLDDERPLFLTEAAPTKITPTRMRKIARATMIHAGVPDLQFGYREIEQGKYLELHDPEAVDLGLQLLKYIQPDKIWLGGDELDAAQLGRWGADSRQQVQTLQMSIDGLHRLLSRIRADNPNAEIENLQSNHVKRIGDYMLKNAFELFGIRPANMPNDWPAMSYPRLLRLDELNIKYQDAGYPGSISMVTPNLGTFHGDKADRLSTAAKYVQDYDFDIWFYHDHSYSVATKVTKSGKIIQAFGSGCWTRTTGEVPGYGTSVGEKGAIGQRQMNWNQGLPLVIVDPKTQKYRHLFIPFHRDENNLPWAEYDNKIFKATPGGFSGLERPDMHI